MERIAPTTTIARLLDHCREHAATDLHAQADKPYVMRIHGALVRISTEAFPTPSEAELLASLAEALSPETCTRIHQSREVDLSFYHAGHRYRGNFSKQRGSQAFSLRAIPQQRLRLKDLQLPRSLRGLLDEPRGLVLVTGPTGQGKSTTLRALLQELNESQALRVITIEDPIEYLFEDQRCHFEQREVGIDTASFADGIRNAMRQDPNVLFIGEIRDRESIFASMQAAETGHLVLTTLHADSVAQAVGRIREYYPQGEQSSISGLLARNLNAIVCQRLLPNTRGTRTPCLEILRRDAGVERAIASHELELLSGIVEASVHLGMHTFDQYLMQLLVVGGITEAVAHQYAVNRHQLEMQLRGIRVNQAILRPDEDR